MATSESWNAEAEALMRAVLSMAWLTGSGSGHPVDSQWAIRFKERIFVDRIGAS
jgi:hypothetical protein